MSCKGEALDIIVTQRPLLLAYARRLVGDEGQAEDVLQEAWIRLKRLEPRVRLDQPAAYVRTVIRNLAMDYRRAAVRERRRAAGDLTLVADQPAEGYGAESTVQARSDLRQVAQALSELPDRVGLAVRLHRLEGLKLREIADRLGVSTATAHALVSEGLLHCARRLSGEDR